MRSFPPPDEFFDKIPLSPDQAKFVNQSRQSVASILSGADPRLLLIIGPCSIHNPQSALEYAHRLGHLAAEVSDVFFVIMRTYFEKPRTIKGWKGLLYDPHLDGSHNLIGGLTLSRQLLSDLTDMQIPCGSELLDIMTPSYYFDFLTWGCVGARTCTSQPHRQLVSGLPFPVGFKNTMDGNVENAIHAILSANSSHSFLNISPDGRLTQINTQGNKHCHVILRGSDKHPNYDAFYVQSTMQKCSQASITNRIIVDCSHDNCHKKHHLQLPAFESIIDQILNGSNIGGLMLESFLMAGNQQLTSSPHPKLSITDPCIDWETTKSLIYSAYEALEKQPFCLLSTR